MKKKAPTMADVAKAAGVSQTTVSLVLAGKAGKNIPEKTRQRIYEACNELNYHVNRLASALNRPKSGIIGMVANELLTTDFAGDMVNGAQKMTWKKGKVLMLVSIDTDDDAITQKAIEHLIGFRVESIVYAANFNHEVSFPEALTHVPTVLVNCYEATETIPCIVPDDYGGAYALTQYLLENGHTKIIYLSNNLIDDRTGKKIPATLAREAGFLQALRDRGLNPDPAECILPISINGSEVVKVAMEILQRKDRPTAIMCYNDRMAMGVYSASALLGLKIPNDLSVVGYDNQKVVSEFLYPYLTTVELPHYQMGEMAIRYLETHKYPFRYVQKAIMPRLVIRDSVRKI